MNTQNQLAQNVDYKKEFERRKSQCQQILELLKSGDATTDQLQGIAFNYTMRISDLRKEGHKILATYLKPGVWLYTYKGHKDDDEKANKPSAWNKHFHFGITRRGQA